MQHSFTGNDSPFNILYIYRYTVTLKMHVSLAQVNRSKSSWQAQSFSTGTFIQKGAAFLEKGAFLFHGWHTFQDSMENTLLFKKKLFIRVCACMHLQSLNPYWLQKAECSATRTKCPVWFSQVQDIFQASLVKYYWGNMNYHVQTCRKIIKGWVFP